MRSVLFINYEYPPIGAGAANATCNIAVTMAKQGWRVSVVTSAFKNRFGRVEEDGVIIYRLRALRRYAGRSSLLQMFMYVIAAACRLPSVIQQEKPDAAIVFFSFPCGPLGLLLKYRWRIPYLLMLRGGDVPGFEPSLDNIHRLLRPLRRAVYRSSSAIIANSEGLRDLALQSDPGIDIAVIPNGVDTDFFAPEASTETTTDHPFTLLFAGRLCAQKNLPVLIEAAARCRTDEISLRLIIIGEGPALTPLRQLVLERGLQPVVQWTGWCSKEVLRDFYRHADCFVNPSTAEGMSNAVLEAMACGLPVIAGDCPGNRELISNMVNGILFDPNDSTQLAEYMLAVAEDLGLGNRLGKAARHSCCASRSWSSVAARLSDHINRLCGDTAD